jgi:hypothetical protein
MIFAFNAIFIDYARIIAAERQLESAVKAGVRSVLSAYDQTLKDEYKLFGLNMSDEEINILLEDIISRNLYKNMKVGNNSFIDTKLDAVSFSPQFALDNEYLFERQILEDMKYKAPIEIMLGISSMFFDSDNTEGFDNIEKQLDEAEKAEKELENLEQYLKNREKAIDEIENELHEEMLQTSEVLYDINDLIIFLKDNPIESQNEVINGEEIVTYRLKDDFYSHREQLQQDLESLDDIREKLTYFYQETLELSKSYNDEIRKIEQKLEEIESNFNNLIQDVDGYGAQETEIIEEVTLEKYHYEDNFYDYYHDILNSMMVITTKNISIINDILVDLLQIESIVETNSDSILSEVDDIKNSKANYKLLDIIIG